MNANLERLAVRGDEALVNVTWAGQNGDLPDPINYDSRDRDIIAAITEAVRHGAVLGVTADPVADLSDFVVDRFPATDARPYNLIQVRPKTPFGSGQEDAHD